MRCKKGWLETYLNEYVGYDESPKIFHTWSALSAIASALGRKVYVQFARRTNIYPNLYVILTAESATCRKSPAGRASNRLVRKIPGIKFLAKKITNEAIYKALYNENKDGKDAVATVYIDEFQQFICMANVTGETLYSNLIELYDCQEINDYDTKMSGTFPLTNCCLNILACSTQESLQYTMPGSMMGIGLEGRILFIVADEPGRIVSWPLDIEPAESEYNKIEEMLINDLIDISKMKGEFPIAKNAKDYIKKWYETTHQDERLDFINTMMKHYYGRRQTTLIKTSTIIAIGRGHDEITLNDVERALYKLHEVEPDMPRAFKAVIFSPSTKGYEKLLDIIRKEKQVTHSDLFKRVKEDFNVTSFREAIQTFISRDEIEVYEDDKEGRGKKARVYRYIE